jgi:hypothetical protein
MGMIGARKVEEDVVEEEKEVEDNMASEERGVVGEEGKS